MLDFKYFEKNKKNNKPVFKNSRKQFRNKSYFLKNVF